MIEKVVNIKNVRYLFILVGVILVFAYYRKKNYLVAGIGALLIMIGLFSNEEFIRKYVDIITQKISSFFDNIISFVKENISPKINSLFSKIKSIIPN